MNTTTVLDAPKTSSSLATAGSSKRFHATRSSPGGHTPPNGKASTARKENGEEPRTDRALRRRAAGLTTEGAWQTAFTNWRSQESSPSLPPPERLTNDEWTRVLQGWTVARPLDFELEGRKYVGGASYQVIHADSDDVLDVLMNERLVPQAVPLVRRAEQLDTEPESLPPFGDTSSHPTRVTLAVEQGNVGMFVRYSIRLTRLDPHTLRFELDKGQAHDIRDVRGYVTAHPLNETHSLVTLFVGLDLQDGIVGSVMKRRAQKVALSTPAHLGRYLESVRDTERENTPPAEFASQP